MSKKYNLKKIRALLTKGFTDEELRQLCFDVYAFRPVYYQLTEITSKTEIVQKLLEYADQKELIETLLDQAKERNPAKYKKYQPYIEGAISESGGVRRESQSPPIPPLPREFAYDVFVSYSEADRPWILTELLPRLEGAGLKTWFDFRDFAPGMPRPTQVQQAVENSRRMLLILTPDYLKSKWGEFAILMAQTRDPASDERRLIPLLKAPCTLPLRLQVLWPIDFVDPVDWDLAWTQLLTTLKAPLDP